MCLMVSDLLNLLFVSKEPQNLQFIGFSPTVVPNQEPLTGEEVNLSHQKNEQECNVFLSTDRETGEQYSRD